MAAIDDLVNIQITQLTSAVSQASFGIPAIFGPSNRFSSVTPTATTVSNSNVITGLSSITGVLPGAKISGAGIPAGTSILSVSGTQAVLSALATASASGVTVTVKDAIRSYSKPADMLSDGFQTSDGEYIRALVLMKQTPVTPSNFCIGSYSNPVTQVDTLAVNTLVASGHIYSLNLNGVLISYTSATDTEQSILTALLAAINLAFTPVPVNGVVTGTGAAARLTLTSTSPGAGVSYSGLDADLTQANVTQNHSIATEIDQARIQNDTWYGLTICSNTSSDILQVASYIESVKKIFIAASADPNIPTTSVSDLASVLKGLGYKRTALFYSPASANLGIGAAWLGGLLPTMPGSSNWAYKTLVGISPDTLNDSQILNIYGNPKDGIFSKNCNCYSTQGGRNITQMGQMVGGQYIDITIGIDWLTSKMQSNIYSQLTALSKIPYTDIGMTVLMQQVRAALDQGIANGLIDGNTPISLTAPPVLSVPASQRANRIAPTISFDCRLQGALNAVNVAGVITV